MSIAPKKQSKLSLVNPLSIMVSASLVLAGAASWAQTSSEQVFKRKAGSWQMKIDIEKLEGAGTSEAVRLKMQEMINQRGQEQLCLTEAAAAKEDFVGNMRNSAKNNDCKNAVENVTASTMNIVAKCNGPDGKEFTISMEGDYSPTSTNMILKSEKAPSKNGPVTMHMRTSSTWTGPCKAGQKEMF
jgi:hypothetical protein